ncbi:MAG: FecR family protein [Acidobacteriaceae bacterium]
MRYSARKFGWMGRTVALCFCLAVMALASAQTETTAPAPPADQTTASQTLAPTLQQPAPESHVRAVRLSDVHGGVQVLQAGEVAFQQAELNMPVVEGMKLVTAEDGRAEVQFEDGSVARVTPNSSITLTELARSDDGTTITVIEADTGLTYYELNGRAGQYKVRFGQDTIAPVDASIFRLDRDNPAAELAVMHGSVHVSDDENLALDVHTDQSVKFDPQNADEYQLLQSVTASTWDQWNSDRDEALAVMDENATEARANSDEPNNPAWSDLDANGNWYNVPGEGLGWSPSGVGDDWDPYGLGAWGYYSGIGYTWISGYSWGWWPYRCGLWSWFGDFGWMWFPGNCGWGGMGFGVGWYPYGAIVAAPPGYRYPRRPGRIHHPGRRPIDHPRHGPVLHQNLIAVNRGPKFTNQFRSVGVKTVPRLLFYDGQNIAPVKKTVRVEQGGPLGEGFATAVRRSRFGFEIPAPGAPGRGAYAGSAYAGSMYRPRTQRGGTVYQPGMHPRPGFTPAPVFRAPARAPAFHAPPPVFHAPPPAFHPAPAPAPAGHGRR